MAYLCVCLCLARLLEVLYVLPHSAHSYSCFPDSALPDAAVPSTKDWAAKKVTIFNSIFPSENLREGVIFLTYSLIDYLVHEITKEF